MPLDFALRIMAKLLCSCLCLFDAIVELHVVDEKMIFDVIYIYIHSNALFLFCNCSGGIYHIKLQILIQIHESIF